MFDPPGESSQQDLSNSASPKTKGRGDLEYHFFKHSEYAVCQEEGQHQSTKRQSEQMKLTLTKHTQVTSKVDKST